MPSLSGPVIPAAERFTAPPDPGQAVTLDDLVERLRLLKVWAGDLSYERIKDRINAAWSAAGRPASERAGKTTVVACFKPGRRRLNTDLVVAIVQALHPDLGYVTQWRQALRIVGGETQAASQVRVQDRLPPDPAGFTGRGAELDRLCQGLLCGQRDGDAAGVIFAIAGMAGVGKTQLAVHAAHLLDRGNAFERVLFVNLRGFHPDPAQPPAEPGAVLDGFLRLLGVPGQQIPHDLPARAAAYRARLAGVRALVVLDNAAGTEQVRPLLPATPGCLTLITSRRGLTELDCATHLSVDVFAPEEAWEFLARALPEVPAGADLGAAARIAARCGHLPLALSLVAGHMSGTPGWTLTDHADRLDERHRHRRLESGVELALDLSYHHLDAQQQRLLRLLALHPGHELDTYAAAALAGTDLCTCEEHLSHLCRDHLLQKVGPGRYVFHDLVRAYATSRAGDQDPPPQRRAALTRLLDFYLTTAATAMDTAYPFERQRRPRVPPTVTAPRTSVPSLAGTDLAEQWLDTELANLLAAAQHAAENGWPEHVWDMSATVDRHLHTRGRYRDAETLHQQALRLARRHGRQTAEMHALNSLGYVHRWLGHYDQAADHFSRALHLARSGCDRHGELSALTGLGLVQFMFGRYGQAGEHYRHALRIARDIGDRSGERHTLIGLGYVHRMLGDYEQAIRHHGQALRIARDIGDRSGERHTLAALGDVHLVLCDYEQASKHHGQAQRIARDIGDRSGELYALAGLGYAHLKLARHKQAGDHFEKALLIAQEIGDRNGELQALTGLGHLHLETGRHHKAASRYQQVFELAGELGSGNWQFEALQGLGRLHHATGRPELAINRYEQALEHATELAQPTDQARAHNGLAHAHLALHQHERARRHWQVALDILTDLGTDHTEDIETSVPKIRAHLTDIDQRSSAR